MAEDVGKLEVEYVVISDAAVRRLERLQKELDKVEAAAEKQGKTMEATFKKAGKAMAAFGAIATGVLYGIIRASAYSSMWLDQISHQMTRIATKILEILGLDKAIEFFIKQLDNLADELTDPGENDFWKRLGSDFMDLSLKGKLAVAAIVLLTGAILVLTTISAATWVAGIISKFAATTLGAKLLTGGLALLKGAFAFLISPAGLVVIAVAAIIAIFVYLWSQTDHGKAQIQSLINMWNNFKQNISDVGWFKAIVQMLKDFGKIWLYGVIQIVKKIYETFQDFFGGLGGKLYDWGRDIITKLVDGIKKMIPLVIDRIWYIYDNFWNILTRIKELAYNKAIEIYHRLVDGFNNTIQWVKDAFSKLTDIWNMESDVIVVEANQTGEDVATNVAAGIDTKANAVETSATDLGGCASDGLREGVTGASDSVCDEMIAAGDCVDTGVGIINESLDGIDRNIEIAVNYTITSADVPAGTSEYNDPLSGGGAGFPDSGDGEGEFGNTWTDSDSGDGSGGYHASSWSAGWKVGGYATGGHVLRGGAVVTHQGEDIVNLKSLLSGIKNNQSSNSGGIVINPTINISSSGVNHDPFETNRVADVISKRMGDELRRITTNI